MNPVHLRQVLQAVDRRTKAGSPPNVRRTLRQAIVLARQLADDFRAYGESIPASRLELAILTNTLSLIDDIINWAVMGTTIANRLKPEMIDAYLQGGKVADRQLRGQGIAIRFDVMDIRAEQWAERFSAQLVTEITADQRQGISDLIARAQREGRTPHETAVSIQQSVGLQSRQIVARDKYRATLVSEETPPDKVNRLVDKYERALLRYRSETIARNELLRSTHEGQLQLVREGLASGMIDRNRTSRRWIVTPDDRLDTELCLPMSEPDQGDVPADEPWILPDGREVWIPQDSHVNCRCSFSLFTKHAGDDE